MRLILIVLCIISFSVQSKSYKNYGSVIISKVVRIYDADTFFVNIDNYPAIVGEEVPIRVKGIDAPEIRGKCESEREKARNAQYYTVKALRTAKVVELKNIQRGKYFRILADVYLDGSSLAEGLMKAGHARIYDGGKRYDWCSN